MRDCACKALGVIGGNVHIGMHLASWRNPAKKDFSGDYFTPDAYLSPHQGIGAMCLFQHALLLKGAEGLRDHDCGRLATKRDGRG